MLQNENFDELFSGLVRIFHVQNILFKLNKTDQAKTARELLRSFGDGMV